MGWYDSSKHATFNIFPTYLSLLWRETSHFMVGAAETLKNWCSPHVFASDKSLAFTVNTGYLGSHITGKFIKYMQAQVCYKLKCEIYSNIDISTIQGINQKLHTLFLDICPKTMSVLTNNGKVSLEMVAWFFRKSEVGWNGRFSIHELEFGYIEGDLVLEVYIGHYKVISRALYGGLHVRKVVTCLYRTQRHWRDLDATQRDPIQTPFCNFKHR